MESYNLILFGYSIAIIDLLIFLFTATCSIYCIYLYIRLKTDINALDSKIVLPADKELRKCRDKKAFLRYIHPKMLVLGIILLVSSVIYLVGIVAIQVDLLPSYFYWIMIVPVLAGLVYYTTCQKKAAKLYW